MLQRSKEWLDYRGPRITASKFGDVLANPETKRYKEYQSDIIDAISGVPNFDDDDKPWFRHGKEWEEEGIGRYEWETGAEVQRVGVRQHPKYSFIAGSADGLIGENGGMELKCRKSLTEHLNCIRVGMPSNHKPQVQGYMWIYQRDWWDFVSYYKNGLKTMINIFRVESDTEYHKRLEEACLKFWEEIQNAL